MRAAPVPPRHLQCRTRPALPRRPDVQGFYVLAFSFLDQIKEPTQVSATVKLLKDSITGGSGKAALRLNM